MPPIHGRGADAHVTRAAASRWRQVPGHQVATLRRADWVATITSVWTVIRICAVTVTSPSPWPSRRVIGFADRRAVSSRPNDYGRADLVSARLLGGSQDRPLRFAWGEEPEIVIAA
jgi:hypothetical protein